MAESLRPDKDRLRELWIESGRQGADKLYDKAVRAGLSVTRKAAQEFVKAQSTSQVFQARPKSDGRVVATGPNKVWQVDIVDFKQFSEKANKGFKYILVAVDVFSRVMKAAPLKTKSPEETARVFRTFAPLPSEVDTDHGNEWSGEFQKLLDDKGIGHREKDPKQVNALAVGDRAIGTLKGIIAKDMSENQRGGNWQAGLKSAVSAYNDTSHSHLMGSHPDDVGKSDAGGKTLTYELKVQAGEDIKHNSDLYKDKVAALKKAGAFRTMQPRGTWARAHQPSWGDKVHKVSYFSGADVIDEEGQRFPVKLVLPVPKTSIEGKVPSELRGGRPARTSATTQTMRPFATILRGKLAGDGLALQVAGRRMNEADGFKEAMKEAKLVGIGSFRRFVELFPRMFKIEGVVPRQTVSLV